MPYPGAQYRFTMHTVNFNSGSDCYQEYNMHLDEILLCIMFIRFYFFIDSFTLLAPMNHLLSGKRIMKNLNLDSNLSFQMKANLRSFPFMSMTIAAAVGILYFAYIVRIFERPYWHQSGLLNFVNIGESIWLVVISMTTVGYGNMYPVTLPGRSIMLIAIVYGAFLLALLIEVIAIAVALEKTPKQAIVLITD